MVIDLCLREVKTALGSKLETTAALFLLCVCGGRGSIRKEVVGGRCAMKGRQWRVICYISLMSRWPNGSRKSVSFSWGNQSSRSHSPDQIFQVFPYPSVWDSKPSLYNFQVTFQPYFSQVRPRHHLLRSGTWWNWLHGGWCHSLSQEDSWGVLFACWIYSDQGPPPVWRLAHLILSAPWKQAMPGVELK